MTEVRDSSVCMEGSLTYLMPGYAQDTKYASSSVPKCRVKNESAMGLRTVTSSKRVVIE